MGWEFNPGPCTNRQHSGAVTPPCTNRPDKHSGAVTPLCTDRQTDSTLVLLYPLAQTALWCCHTPLHTQTSTLVPAHTQQLLLRVLFDLIDSGFQSYISGYQATSSCDSPPVTLCGSFPVAMALHVDTRLFLYCPNMVSKGPHSS